MKWLDEHVITDQVYNIIEVVAWEALWDQAKKLRKREIDDLEAQYKSQPVRISYYNSVNNLMIVLVKLQNEISFNLFIAILLRPILIC